MNNLHSPRVTYFGDAHVRSYTGDVRYIGNDTEFHKQMDGGATFYLFKSDLGDKIVASENEITFH